MEKKVLSALVKDRSSYDKLQGHMSPEDFSDKGAILFESIARFYENDPDATKVDSDIIMTRIEREYPKHADSFRRILGTLEDVSAKNVVKEYIDLRKEKASQELAHALLDPSTKTVETQLEEFNKWREADLTEENDTYIQGMRLHDLDSKTKRDNLIPVAPKVLNEAVGGGVPPQTHILIYAPPEVGKSLFSIHMACGFMHAGKKVLYWGNEDPDVNMLWRFYTCLLGKERYEILKDMDSYQAKADERGYGNLIFIPSDGGTLFQLEKAIKAHRPDVVFLDQIGNFSVKDKEGTMALESISKGFRSIIKRHNLVGVSIHQADADAQGKLYLDIGDVYFSNVGVQAAMDIMIGLGATKEMLNTNQRMINLTKNKINGNHEPFEVSFAPRISRVIDR